MTRKIVDTILPTTMVGSYPRPHWFKHQLLGRDIRVAFKEVQHEEAYDDAVATVRGQLGRFNTPNTDNIRLLISDALGLQDIQTTWAWQNCTSAQAVQRLADAMTLRHQIAHGVNPRPGVTTLISSQLPNFFRRLGRCTNHAVQEHFVNVHGIAHPWPP